MNYKRNLIAFFLLTLFLSIGCDSSEPEILDVQWQINIIERRDKTLYEENLCIFVSVKDEDGEGDLESLFILHDSSELYWKFSKDSWTASKSDGEYWIGSSDIVMPDGSAIPRGEYRIVVYDASGAKSVFPIKIDTVVINPKRIPFPSIKGENSMISLESKLENVFAILFDQNSRFIDTFVIEYDKNLLEQFPRYRDLSLQSKNQLFLYVWDSRKGYGVMSGPYIGLYDDATKSN